MKQVVIGIAILVAVGGYLWWSMKLESADTAATASSPAEPKSPKPATTTGASPWVAPAGKYKNGSYMGAVVDSIYGPVQVGVVVKGGKIVTVNVPVYPNDPGHTTDVSNESIPLLKREVLKIQNAEVQMISGATQTVEAFQISLRGALAKAL
jgi:uncharacterized protein with FMN-binding domain